MLAPLGRSKRWTPVELVDDHARPVPEHLRHRDAVRDREGQVEIRPAIAVAEGERADHGTGDDALVRCSQLEYPVAREVAVVEGEKTQGPSVVISGDSAGEVLLLPCVHGRRCVVQ